MPFAQIPDPPPISYIWVHIIEQKDQISDMFFMQNSGINVNYRFNNNWVSAIIAKSNS